jgi:Fur family ferric uptake transcriptional regulator
MTTAPRRPPVVLHDLDEAAEAVRQAGGRLTTARRAVLEALFAARGPVSVEQVAGASTDLTSAYRNLEWLEAHGLVRHIHVGHGPGLYTLAGEAITEYLVCERCAAITTIDADRLRRARAEIRKAAGFVAHFDHFPIHGLCPACSAEPAVSPGPAA